MAAPVAITAATPAGSIYDDNFSKPFIEVAKKATPCVVSIKSQISHKKWSQRNEMWDEPIDPFNDEFWNKFFGFPAPQRPDRKTPRIAQGSGFVISADGYIFTNNHLVQDADKITVMFNNGKEFPATLIGADPNTDVALLKIDATHLPFLVLANSNLLEVGQWVIAIGNPLGFKTTVTTGIVSALGRNDLEIAPIEEFIQTDAPINQGNSGGCLLNLHGEVVGMNTAIATNNGGSIGIGFAIPSNLLEYVKAQLLKTGKVTRGYLGIVMQPVIDKDLAQALKIEENSGALITEVIKESPADKGGLQAGDVIVKVNDKSIANAAALRNTIAMMAPNEKIHLTVKRNDKVLTLSVTIGSFAESEPTTPQEMKSTFGISVETLTPESARKYGYGEESGVIIKHISPDSPASEIGLRRGDLVMSVNRMPVHTVEEFYRQVKHASKEKQIMLHIKRGQMSRFVLIPVE